MDDMYVPILCESTPAQLKAVRAALGLAAKTAKKTKSVTTRKIKAKASR
jgi:hypothetical protein